jgi:hypothetical protein
VRGGSGRAGLSFFCPARFFLKTGRLQKLSKLAVFAKLTETTNVAEKKGRRGRAFITLDRFGWPSMSGFPQKAAANHRRCKWRSTPNRNPSLKKRNPRRSGKPPS